MAGRIRRSDWIRHGLTTLTQYGPEALTAVNLCARLGVSRGSFYWHFPDINQFKSDLLDAWEEQNTEAIIRALARRPPEEDELAWLLNRAFRVRRRLDQAIRRWGVADDEVMSRVRRTDERRRERIEQMLRAEGLTAQAAKTRALLIYWAFIGHSMTAPGEVSRSTIRAAIEELTSLVRAKTPGDVSA